MSITLVTCWYNLKSKFNEDTYKKWMSNFLDNVNNFNLVIFTNKKSYKLIETYQNKKIKIILKEFDDFETWGKKKYWEKNHKMNFLLNDKSIFKTDWKLNMLWSEKINFVNETFEKKYFETEWYGWCDIGYFREGKCNLKWPSTSKINCLNNNKIYYGLAGNKNDLCDISKIILNTNDKKLPVKNIPYNQVSIAGGFFVINKTKIKWWHNTYYCRLYNYFQNNYLVKDDQIIIIDCIINNINEFKIVEEKNPYKNKWFVFQTFLL